MEGEQEDEHPGYVIVKNRKAKSSVWEHFGLKKRRLDQVVDKSLAVCRRCNVTVKTSGGTTNLTTHLRRHHPLLLSPPLKKIASNASGPSSASGVSSCEVPQSPQLPSIYRQRSMHLKYDSKSVKAAAITKNIANFIIKDLRPFRIVDAPEFRHLISSLDPRYSMPSRKQFAEEIIPAMYISVSQEIKEKLKCAEQVALTTDGWTSRATESYMTDCKSYKSRVESRKLCPSDKKHG